MTDHGPRPASIEALQAALRACTRCAFAHPARPVVSGSGTARILLIGQAPGKTEQQVGHGWSGPAGKRLIGWMTRVVGFESEARFREQVYLAAVTRCYPGPNPRGHGDRKPGPAEIARCGEWLAHELALLRPGAILLVGGLAIERFLGKVKLEAVVGHTFPMRFDDFETVLIPLPHPSGASTWLNDPEHARQLERGLLAFRAVIAERGLAALNEPAKRPLA